MTASWQGSPSLWPYSRPSRSRFPVDQYDRYVRPYGNRDVSVSTITSQAPVDTRARLKNLISALRSTGKPLPRAGSPSTRATPARSATFG